MTVSIALATYNGGRYLREQLDSLYAQTRLADEVVVSDDGSSDDTLSILEEYKQRYGLCYSVNTGEHGVNANFFRAIRLCKGDLVQICDQDDIWMENKTAVLVHQIEKMNPATANVVSSLRYDMDADGRVTGGEQYEKNDGWRGTLLTYGRNQGCTMMMNRKMVEEVLHLYDTHPKEVLSMYYDEVIAYTAVIVGEKVNLSDQLMYYRHHDKNVVDADRGPLQFRDKVRLVPTFWGMTLDERWMPMHTISVLLHDRIQDAELKSFLTHVDQIVATEGTWAKLGKIMHIEQLSVSERARILVKSVCSILLKKIYHYPTL